MLVVQSEQEAAMIRDGNGAIWRRLKSASISLWRGPTDDSARDAEVLETLDAPEPRNSAPGFPNTSIASARRTKKAA
jgi:hypothetical protein